MACSSASLDAAVPMQQHINSVMKKAVQRQRQDKRRCQLEVQQRFNEAMRGVAERTGHSAATDASSECEGRVQCDRQTDTRVTKQEDYDVSENTGPSSALSDREAVSARADAAIQAAMRRATGCATADAQGNASVVGQAPASGFFSFDAGAHEVSAAASEHLKARANGRQQNDWQHSLSAPPLWSPPFNVATTAAASMDPTRCLVPFGGSVLSSQACGSGVVGRDAAAVAARAAASAAAAAAVVAAAGKTGDAPGVWELPGRDEGRTATGTCANRNWCKPAPVASVGGVGRASVADMGTAHALGGHNPAEASRWAWQQWNPPVGGGLPCQSFGDRSHSPWVVPNASLLRASPCMGHVEGTTGPKAFAANEELTTSGSGRSAKSSDSPSSEGRADQFASCRA
eukprot:TRINITY_DN38120_c0_g1_i1.p1 TRINITY_DN38120_c0_g1~~TRINITY_DN38120_c0_g1_i1.p1  ORF type:complete len:415 (+),score=76.51 TRINITY_DN38120_c0_g1_i1:45-1247(+)